MSEDRLDHISKEESRNVQRQRFSPDAGASQTAPNPLPSRNGVARRPANPRKYDEHEKDQHGERSNGRASKGGGGEEKVEGGGVGVVDGDGGNTVVMQAGEKLQLHLLSRVAYVSPDRRTIEGSLMLTNYRMEFAPVRTDDVNHWCHYVSIRYM